MRALVLVAIAGCTRPIAVHAPAGVRTADPRWVVTRPHLAGDAYVAASGDDVYALDCHRPATLRELGGDGAWTRAVGTTCSVGEHGHPVAAGDRGVVTAFTGPGGLHMAAFGRDGTPRWARVVAGDLRDAGVAMHGDRTALCTVVRNDPVVLDGKPLAASFGTALALVFDGRGALVEQHAIEHVYDPIACSFDRDGALWAVTPLGKQATVDGRGRDLSDATYAVRLTGGIRVVRLFAGTSIWATAMPDGFAIATYHEGIAFIDRQGKQRWRLAIESRGCSMSISPIGAAPDHLLAGLWVMCGQRHGSVRLGDLALVDQTEPQDDLAETNVIAAFDPVAGKTLGVYTVDRTDLALKFLPTGDGILMTGWFHGNLGLGTRIRSGPDEYQCRSTLPTDARTWSSYDTDRPSCRSGFYLDTSQPSWPFIARFVLPAR